METALKVLITGSHGQLGRELQSSVPENIELTSVDVEDLDITNTAKTAEFVSAGKFDLIINAAAYTAVDRAEKDVDAAFAVNCHGVASLADAAKIINARIIHVSTDYVFDGQACRPYLPEDKTTPLGVYGLSKRAGEEALLKILPDAIVVRTAWLYSQHGTNFVKTMLRLMKERDALGVVADQVGTPTSANSLAEVIWQIALKPEIKGIFHWTDAGVASWYDFAVAIREEGIALGMLSGDKGIVRPIRTEDYPTPTKRPAFSILDKTSLYQALGIKSQVHWRQQLRLVMAQLRVDF
ncbi:MAG: dTDP-4-dehydrorhamnose reductase [Victivallaceae bacterium]